MHPSPISPAIALVAALVLAQALVPAADGPASAPDAEALSRFALGHEGDPALGRSLFFDESRAACSRCHKAGGEGGEVGPDLSDVGAKLDRPYLVESVLEPSRQIVEGYRASLVATADGRVLSGLVRAGEDGSLVIVDSEARVTTVPADQVEQRSDSDLSQMPDDLAASLSPEEFAGLISYLGTLRTSEQPTPGGGIKGPASLPPGFVRETFAEGLTGVTALAVAPDGRVFVCEQVGRLRVVKDGALLPEPFATLEVDDHWERGLIGVAVDPDFDRNGFVYTVSVAASPYPHHQVTRFTAEGDRAAPGSAVVLFEGDDQRTLGGKVPAGHQGGAIHFGPDGMLYVALGEQTAESPAQRLDSLLGKILRLDPDGSIPADNPFLDRTEGKYRAIWAIGCRNVFTFAFQPETGLMLLNDVGGEAEEINVGRPGADYGWPVIEHGPTDRPEIAGPIHWYPTASICGGAFCPASPVPGGFPAEYRGKYFFMDFVKGWIRALDPDDPRRPVPARTFALGLARPVDLAFSPDGSLYVLLRDAWVRDSKFEPGTGSLHRIRYVGPSPPPRPDVGR
ncbi:PQQ-dependent sugar dehydrogenase [Tautonia plasticadhaerens]|uniref:Soluble aldose sugar dehydrogenase YliI n=1 Tax=Tautonia plasticadhaerens TaxID=2527974 RepID=A0A518H3R6_9BACT|nr:PQQ-dependent sugar dehydrogenase [Tautonia plasticadhaerens]QDV35463.1 Soluble aldose sugar dehydrogenase YliI precursor [Tautonia plasticadhaerens]